MDKRKMTMRVMFEGTCGRKCRRDENGCESETGERSRRSLENSKRGMADVTKG